VLQGLISSFPAFWGLQWGNRLVRGLCAVPVAGEWTLCWHCEEHGGRTRCPSYGAWSLLSTDAAITTEIQLRKWLSHSAMNCLSQQHPIRTLRSEVLPSPRPDGVSARRRFHRLMQSWPKQKGQGR